MKVVCFGEGMIELARGADGQARVGSGGDTLNTAVYLARLGVPVSFLTALGGDPWSEDLRKAWGAEGVALDLALTHPGRAPGLYAIATDAAGERSFTYWRDQSAARALFDCPGVEDALALAARCDLLLLSGITLALFDDAGRARIGALLRAVRANGGRVAFDPNHRARLWPDVGRYRAAVTAIRPYVSIALPSFDDERAVWGDAAPDATFERWSAGGVETIVKNGSEGALTAAGWVPAPVRVALDTTGAGDSFNAGYLSARLAGHGVEEAARRGARLAAEVVRHPGAIIPRHAMPVGMEVGVA